MHVDDRVPHLVGDVLDYGVPCVAGVVDDDVEPAELAHGGLHDHFREVGRGHAAHTGRGDAARCVDRIDHAFRHVAVQVVDDHMSAVFGEQRGDRAANAPPGACDDCGFAFKQ